MENEKAIEILINIRNKYLKDNSQEEAEALFLGIKAIAANTNQPYIKCKGCGKWYRRFSVEAPTIDNFGVTEYCCLCPYCGEDYFWNDYYWR